MNIKKLILYEDNHLLIVNKPSGILSQKDINNQDSIIEICKKYITKRDEKQGNIYLSIINRLDRPTSGIIILSKSSKCTRKMNELIKNRKIKKIYLAIVDKCPPKKYDILEHFLIKNKKKNITKSYDKEIKGSKKSILNYSLIGQYKNFFYLKIDLITGRSHQIRSQLSKINIHINGDIKYGSKIINKDKSISLHSYILEFFHPVKKQLIKIKCIPEGYMWNNVNI